MHQCLYSQHSLRGADGSADNGNHTGQAPLGMYCCVRHLLHRSLEIIKGQPDEFTPHTQRADGRAR